MISDALTVRKPIRESKSARFRAVWRVIIPLMLTIGGIGVVQVGFFLLAEAIGITHAGRQAFIAILSGVFVAGVLVLSANYIDNRRVRDYGFDILRRWITDFVGGSLLGLLLIGLLFVITYQLGWITIVDTVSAGDGPFLPMMAVFLLGYAAVGFWEETLFRGIFITNACEEFVGRGFSTRMAAISAWIASSLVFGGLHLLFLSLPEGVPVSAALVIWTLMGGLLGVAYLLTGELAFPIGLHFTLNYAINNLFFHLPISEEAGIPGLFSVEVVAPTIWHPVGGLSLVPIILLGYAVTIGWISWQYTDSRSVERNRSAA